MFEFSFKFSHSCKELVGLWTVIIWVICGLIYGISLIPSPKPAEQFVTSVYETNQPNCVLSSYIMLAKERLDAELFISKLQKQYPILAKDEVSFGVVKPVWDDMFPSNKLECIFDCTKGDDFIKKPVYGKPYLWVGMWDITPTNAINHACLVYFHPDSVTFKHFIYNPQTRYNYLVKTNYDFFCKKTSFIFQVK